jgi:hypothetical protein
MSLLFSSWNRNEHFEFILSIDQKKNMSIKKAWFLGVMNVIHTEAHISAASWDIRSELRPFFRIDPITQINIRFIVRKAKNGFLHCSQDDFLWVIFLFLI